jgi:hypothetical protein
MGHSRHFDRTSTTSGNPHQADMPSAHRYVSKVPETEVSALFDYMIGAQH